MDRLKKKFLRFKRWCKKLFSRQASDSVGGGSGGSRAALSLESSRGEVAAPAAHGPEAHAATSSPTPADTPTVRSGDTVPSTSRLERRSSDGDAASDGGAVVEGPAAEDGRSIAGETPEISPAPALEDAVRGAHDNRDAAAAHVVDSTTKNSHSVANVATKMSEPQAPAALTPQDPLLEDAIHGAHDKRNAAVTIGPRASNAVQLAQAGAVATDEWAERVDNLFKQLSAFCDVLGDIGEIHPYVRLVTGFINAGIQPILKQKARDDAMKKLIEDMDDAFDKVTADDDFKGRNVRENDPRCKLFVGLAKQTVDCAWFIREYYETESFMKRALKGIVNYSVDEKIKEYSEAFVELGQKIVTCDISETVKSVATVSITVTQIGATIALQELVYAEGTGRQNDKACLTGTRISTLDCLADWIFDPDATRVRFVVGVAGSGKSSIAHSVASRLEALGRLGAFFAFDRTNQRLAPWSVFSTVARELADWNADFRHELSAVLSQKGRLAKSRDVFEQWEDLIVRPAQNVHFVGPVLIVIDAFDECTDLRGPASAFDRDQQDRQRARKNLLECLTKRVNELPANFRILVTSRLEPDVFDALAQTSRGDPSDHLPAPVFDNLDLSKYRDEAVNDIYLYIRVEITRYVDDRQLDSGQICKLAEAADGLFEWAAMACRLLKTNDGSTVEERYMDLLKGPHGDLEALYGRTLGRLFTAEPARRRFRAVMAQVLYAAEPLSMNTLRALRLAVGDGAVDLILPNLGSLLSGISDDFSFIRPLHTSFRDFLTKTPPSHDWCVEPGDVHDVIALGALCVLNKSLHFDIWSFPSSYTVNFFINDLDYRMKTLPAGLVYASRHWSYHLSMVSKSDVSLQTELRIFLTQKLLFWLEVASLCNFMNMAVSFLLTAASFFKPLHDGDVIAFINDAIAFVNIFIEPIRDSVPHIYLSALAFCPTTSLIRRSFVRNSSLLPTIDHLAAEWPVALCPHHVDCFAYSPDGIYVALGCRDGVVRLVDAENMHKLVLELARAPGGPSLWVRYVAFSPDGQIIAAAAAHTGDVIWAIFRWNAKTGELLGISQGHTDYVQSLCFSPDGRYIVSASDDQTVRRWDAKTGQQIGDPLRGHSKEVTGAVCSLNSKFIISAGEDATIRIWNVDTGQQDGAPIYPPGQRPLCMSLARSPQRNLIAIGMISEDSSSVWVFDIDQRCFVRELVHQHRNGFPFIAWSYDGRHIASAFADGILLWDCFDFSTTALYTRPTSVNAILFSPDGNRLILTNSSGDLSAVNVATAQSHSLEYHAGLAKYAAYSPDGRFAAVAFVGEDVPYVWDAETGASISDDRVLNASLTWLKPAIDGSLQQYDWDGWGDRQNHRPHDVLSANGLRSAEFWDDKISIWDSASQTLLRPSIRIPSGRVTCVALSPSGDRVLQGSSDGTIRIFHIDQSADNAPLPAVDSALGAQRSNSPEGEHSMPVLRPGWSGWLCDNDGRRIISVPEQYRPDLWMPGLVHILRPNREPARPVKIDVSGVGLGTEWTRCGGALSVDLGNAPMSSEPVAND